MARNTIQRQMVLDAVCAMANHPTSDEIFQRIRATYPDISLGTVYRNLNLMAQAGQIRRICVPGSADRFDFNTAGHYHIKCVRCGGFADVTLAHVHSIEALVARATGYSLSGQDLVFSGVCPTCLAQRQSFSASPADVGIL